MDQSIWDEEKEFVVFDDNSGETTIWEDLERTSSPSDIVNQDNDNPVDMQIKFPAERELYTTIWEDLQKCDVRETKESIKINKANKLSIDWKKRDSLKEEKNFPQVLISPPRCNSNASAYYSPQILLRTSCTNPNASLNDNAYSPLARRVSRCNSGAKSPFSPVIRRISRCNSGASAGRIAHGPDGSIGFHKGRAGEYLREPEEGTSLSRAFAAISFLEEIEGNNVNNNNTCWERRASGSNWNARGSRFQEQRNAAEKINHNGNVPYFGSDSRLNSSHFSQTGGTSRVRNLAVTPQNGVNTSSRKSSAARHAFNFSRFSFSPQLSNGDKKLKESSSFNLTPGRLSMKTPVTQGTQSLTMTCRRLPIKIQEARSTSLSTTPATRHDWSSEPNGTNRSSFSELADEEARLDARIERLSQNVLRNPVLGNDYCRTSCKSRFLDLGDGLSPHHSRYLESFSR